METEKKIVRAKVQLQNENPFFAYLIMNMKFKNMEEVGSMGVDNQGTCYYSNKFVDELSEGELKGVLAHEVLHLVLEHLSRGKKLDKTLFNVSADLVINDILVENNFQLDRRGLIPYLHEYTFEGTDITIEDLNKKTAEQVYNELQNKLSEEKKKQADNKRFDKHILQDKEMTQEQKQAIQGKWKKAVSEASAYARQKGDMPDGLDLFVDNLLNQKLNWKTLLYKYLIRTIPHDYSYARPSKRSFSTGVYMPIMRKEAIEIVVSLDTSGSIQSQELTEFMTEINGIAKSFNNLNMKLVVCDSEIKDIYHIGNGDSEVISKLRIKGGGGTSHKPVYDYVRDEIPNAKLLVNFTDGYTDFNELDNTINTLWVICKNGVDESRIPFGEVIKLQ